LITIVTKGAQFLPHGRFPGRFRRPTQRRQRQLHQRAPPPLSRGDTSPQIAVLFHSLNHSYHNYRVRLRYPRLNKSPVDTEASVSSNILSPIPSVASSSTTGRPLQLPTSSPSSLLMRPHPHQGCLLTLDTSPPSNTRLSPA